MGMNLTFKASPNVNYAVSMLTRRIITDVTVDSDRDLEAVFHISAEPNIFSEKSFSQSIRKGRQAIEAGEQVINVEIFREGIREARDCQITVSLEDAADRGRILAAAQKVVHVQPYNHWDESQSRESLIAFITPNHELVSEVAAKAAELLQEEDLVLKGYAGHTPEQVMRIAKAVYDALCDRKLNYILSPNSFESAGQKIRLPASLLSDDTGMGTCIDLAVLYAACLEAVKLHPALIITKNHCLAGVWTEDRTFSGTILSDLPEILRQAEIVKGDDGKFAKPSDSGNERICGFFPVENTMMTGEKGKTFESAVKTGMSILSETLYVLDVYQGRRQGIVPCFTYTSVPKDARKTDSEEVYRQNIMARFPQNQDRINKLKNEAMDLSRRNPLVAGVSGSESIRLSGCRPSDLSADRMNEYDFTDMVYKSLAGQGLSDDESIQRMKAFCTAVRQSERGNRKGKTAGRLFLTFGELEYKNGSSFCRAPLYLCPLDIYLNSQGRPVISLLGQEIIFNPVLTALMQQKNSVNLEKLSENVKKAGNLTTYLEKYLKKDMETLRFLIQLHSTWKVHEDVMMLSFFSIPNASTLEVLDSKELRKNPVVRSILADYMEMDNKAETDSSAKVDSEDICVLPADRSQVEVIRQIDEKAAQIVTGPAGNGKSRTIVNIVCDQMLKGRNTLIVAKKHSAMEVLYSQMEKLGISPFVLYIKGQEKDLQDELRSQIGAALSCIEGNIRNISDPYSISGEDYRYYGEELSSINGFMRLQDGNSQSTFIELMEDYCGYTGPELISVSKVPEEKWDDIKVIKTLENIAGRMQVRDKIKTPGNEHLRFDQDESQRENVRERVRDTLKVYEKVLDGVNKIDDQLQLHLTGGERSKILLVSKYLVFLHEQVEPLLSEGDFGQLRKEAEDYEQDIRDRILDILDQIEDAQSGKSSRFMQLYKSTVKVPGLLDKLNGLLLTYLPESLYEETFSMDQEDIRDLVNSSRFEIQPDREQGERLVNLKKVEAVYEKLDALFPDLSPETKEGMRTGIEMYLNPDNNVLRETYLDRARDIRLFTNKQKETGKYIIRSEKAFKEEFPDRMIVSLFSVWLDETERRGKNYNLAEDKNLNALGLSEVAAELSRLIREKSLKPENIVDAYKKSVCSLKIRRMKKEHEELKFFGVMDYEISLGSYLESGKELRRMLRKNLLREHLKRNSDLKDGYQEKDISRLHRFAANRVQKDTAKELFMEAHEAFRRLFTCMMMTPEMAADLLSRSDIMFDLAIFEEGSQTATFEALPAVMKAKHIRVFGDRMQMMPQTAFRVRNEEYGIKDPIESILEASHFMPQTTLNNHYRSDSEDLIAFSNKKFYNGTIHTYPSCRTDSRNLIRIQVENGIYNAGKGSKNYNRPEAEKVIELMYQVCGSIPEKSRDTVGVITSNSAQKELIVELYADASRKKPFGREIMVVSLEECQGWEWDYVIISTVYGPTEDGSVSMNMGLIQQEDGENRLNVMITRARKKLYLVTSLTESMFIGRELGEGLKCLRDFIKYAGHPGTSRSSRVFSDLKDLEDVRNTKGLRGISKAVIRTLLEKGYTVCADIGSSRLKVDLAVVSRDHPDRYALGILLDHPEEKDIADIREREVNFPYTLSMHGWNIYRLHTLGWYQDVQMAEAEMFNHLKDAESNVYQLGEEDNEWQ